MFLLQCISTIALVKNEQEVLDSPIWIMLINVVALEMLKAKLPNSAGKQIIISPWEFLVLWYTHNFFQQFLNRKVSPVRLQILASLQTKIPIPCLPPNLQAHQQGRVPGIQKGSFFILC